MKVKPPFGCQLAYKDPSTFALLFWALRGRNYVPMFLKRWRFALCNGKHCNPKTHLTVGVR